MTIDYDALTLVVGLSSVILALVTVFLESRRSRIALQADLLLRLDERFYAPEMIKTRQKAARKLLRQDPHNYELDDILDFFTTLDLLVEYKALDPKLTYEIFTYWVIRYWQVAKQYVMESRQRDPESWIGVEELAERLAARESKRGIQPPNKAEVDRFLSEEARVP